MKGEGDTNHRSPLGRLADLPEALVRLVSKPPAVRIIWMDPDVPPHRQVVEEAVGESAEAPSSGGASTLPPDTPTDGGAVTPPSEPPITDEEFEGWVEDALERVPEQFLEIVENVAFIVEHDPPGGGRNLLGLYHGVPLPGRGHYSGAMPDTITIYQNPLVRVYRTRKRVKEEVYRTVVHEIGHYFGMDDDELHGLGW